MKSKKIIYDPSDYLASLLETRDVIYNSPIEGDPDLKNTLNIISSNLSLFLPDLPFSDHEKFSREVKWHQSWAAIDQNYPHLFDTTKIIDKHKTLEKAKNGKAFIYCTFHLGSYRLLNPLLASKNIPFNLVTDTNFIKTQGEESTSLFERVHAEWNKLGEKTVPVEILDAEKPQIVLQAARKVKSGTSLVFYIDGNTGVGGVLHDKEKSVPLNFFGNKIYARKGISFISHFTKTPIVPVFCSRNGWLDRELHFLKPIEPNSNSDREDYCTKTTKKLYKTFEKYLTQYPEQWEGWFYINKFVDLHSIKRKLLKKKSKKVLEPNFDAKYRLNEYKFGLMDYGINKFILHKESLEMSKIDDDFYKILNLFSKPRNFNGVKTSLGLSESQFVELVNLNLILQDD